MFLSPPLFGTVSVLLRFILAIKIKIWLLEEKQLCKSSAFYTNLGKTC